MYRNVPGEGEAADLPSSKAKSRMPWDAADTQRVAWVRWLKMDLAGAWNRLDVLIPDNLKEGELQTRRLVA